MDLVGLVVAALPAVQIQCLLPRRTGMFVFAECRVCATEPVGSVRRVGSVAYVAIQVGGLLEVLDRPTVVTDAEVDIAEGGERGCLAMIVVILAMDGQGRLTVFAGLVMVTEQCGTPPHNVEGIGLPQRIADSSEQVQAAGAVSQRSPDAS